MFAILAVIAFAVGLVLRLAGSSLGRMDALAWALLGLALLALQIAFNPSLRRP